MKKTQTKQPIIYQGEDGAIEFRGDFNKKTIWGTQKQIAKVFSVNVRTINEHLRNIYKTGELDRASTIRKFRIVQKEGNRAVSRDVNFYNLDAIISVGYRVNSKRATAFRIWATKILRQHILNGYTVNKKRIDGSYSLSSSHLPASISALQPAPAAVMACL